MKYLHTLHDQFMNKIKKIHTFLNNKSVFLLYDYQKHFFFFPSGFLLPCFSNAENHDNTIEKLMELFYNNIHKHTS